MNGTLSRAETLLKDQLRQSVLPPSETRPANAFPAASLFPVDSSSPSDELICQFENLTPDELADLFVSASFFKSVLRPLIDQEWIRGQSNLLPIADMRQMQLKNELHTLGFLRMEIAEASSKQLKAYFNRTTHLLHVLVGFVQMELIERFRAFAVQAMKQIDARARDQDRFPHTHFTEAMYRAFDQMDEILGIRYELDRDMITDPDQRERLYEGAGAGVQTSYSSILLALDRAQVAKDARILDLGSGYGRVGFVLGLLRPDIHFTGFEYVDHRVKDSQAVAKRAGLSRIDFATKDLSDFEIPEADVYYMYDPFSRETYGYVLDQLIAFGRQRAITIITKGRANTWVREALETHGWSIDETCDSGTVCLFRSQP